MGPGGFLSVVALPDVVRDLGDALDVDVVGVEDGIAYWAAALTRDGVAHFKLVFSDDVVLSRV